MCVIEKRQRRKRNCAFEGVKTALDTVKIVTEHGEEIVEIPAIPGTLYWAILTFMYQNANRLVPVSEYCDGVAKIMEGWSASKWEKYCGKETIKTVRKNDLQEMYVVEQGAGSWEQRSVSNGRNLCRIQGANAYGKRLINRGHVMRYFTGEDGEGFFVLYTQLTTENMTPAKRGRRPQKKEVPA